MSERSAAMVIVKPTETIKTKDFLLKAKDVIIESSSLKEFYEDVKNDFPDDNISFEKLVEDNDREVKWEFENYVQELQEGETYLILIMKNSAGFPEQIDAFHFTEKEIPNTFQNIFLKFTFLSFPS